MSERTYEEENRGFEKDNVGLYLDEIARTPLLDAEEEVGLAKRIETGLFAATLLEEGRVGRRRGGASLHATQEELEWLAADGLEAKRHFVQANLRLVVSVARKYGRAQMPLLDMIQEGNTGLIRAVEKFDYTKGYKFSTYATWWIRQAITRGTAQQGRAVRLPVHVVEELNQVGSASRNLERLLGRPPEPAEIAEELGIDETRVLDLQAWGRDHLSLDMPLGEDGESTLGDLIAVEQTAGPDESVMSSMQREWLDKLIDRLDERAADIMRCRYGLLDGRSYKLADIAARHRIGAERVRQIERESLAKLQHMVETGERLASNANAGLTRSELINQAGNTAASKRGRKLLDAEQFAAVESLISSRGFSPQAYGLRADEVRAVRVYLYSHSLSRVAKEMGLNARDARPLLHSSLQVLLSRFAPEQEGVGSATPVEAKHTKHKLLTAHEFAMLGHLMVGDSFQPAAYGLTEQQSQAAKLYVDSKSIARVSKETGLAYYRVKKMLETTLGQLLKATNTGPQEETA